MKKKIVSFLLSILIVSLQMIQSFAVASVVVVGGASAFAGALIASGVYFGSKGVFDSVYEQACQIESTWRNTFQIVGTGFAMVTVKQYNAMIEALRGTKYFDYEDRILSPLVYGVESGDPTIFKEFDIDTNDYVSYRFVPYGKKYTFEFKKGESSPKERIEALNLSGIPATFDVRKSYDYMYLTSYDFEEVRHGSGDMEVSIESGGSVIAMGGEIPFYLEDGIYKRRVGVLLELVYGAGAGTHQIFYDLRQSFRADGLRLSFGLRNYGNPAISVSEGSLTAAPTFTDLPRFKAPSVSDEEVILVPPIPSSYLEKGKEKSYPMPSSHVLPKYNPAVDFPSDVVKSLNPAIPWDYPFGQAKDKDVVAFPEIKSIDVPNADEPATETPPLNPPLDLGWLKNLIESILEWLRKIVDAIKAIPGLLQNLLDLISKFFDVGQFTLNFESFKLVNLQGKFPFCIPFDFLKVVKAFSAKAKEPDLHIKFDTPFLNVDYKIPIAPYKIPIAFFRSVVVIFFSYILISKTKEMIKW